MWGRLPDPLGAPLGVHAHRGVHARGRSRRSAARRAVDRRGRRLRASPTGSSPSAPRSSGAVAQVEVLGIDPAALDVRRARLDAAVAGGGRDEIRADGRRRSTPRSPRSSATSSRKRACARRPRTGSPSYQAAVHRAAWPRPRRSSELAERVPSRGSPIRPSSRSRTHPCSAPPPAAPAARRVRRRELGRSPRRARRVRAPTRPVRPARSTKPSAPTAHRCATRDELRGLLGAYRTRAARTGLAEDPVADDGVPGGARRCCGRRRATCDGGADAGRGVPARRARRRSAPIAVDGAATVGRGGAVVTAQALRRAGLHRRDRGRLLQRLRDRPPAPSRSSAAACRARAGPARSTEPLDEAVEHARSARRAPGSAARRAGWSTATAAIQHLGAGITTVPVGARARPAVDACSPTPRSPRRSASARRAARRSAALATASPAAPRASARSAARRTRSRPKLQPGDVVGGQYEVVGCIAHGGLGWIYLARDRNVSDRYVVLKGLLNTGDADAFEAAIAERQFLAEVQHPLILEIYNFASYDGAGYIVMEYVGGRSLKQILKDRMTPNNGAYDPFPADQAIAYIIEILPAFSYLHSQGLLYCDFKPDNVIQAGDSHQAHRPRRRAARRRRPVGDLRHRRATRRPRSPTSGRASPSDIFTIGRTLAVLAMEFRGYQSTYVASLPPVDDTPLFQRYDSLYRVLGEGDRDRTPTTASSRPTSCATSCSACCARSWPSTAAPPRPRTRPRRRCSARRPARARSSTWTDLPALRVDRADAIGDLARRRVARRRRRSASRCSNRRPSRRSRCSWRRRAPRSTPATFPLADQVRRTRSSPTTRGSGGRCGSSGLAALAHGRLRRRGDRRSTPCSARCRASSRPKLALALACEQTGRRRSRRAALRGVRGRPTRTTSRRPRSAWPGPGERGDDRPARSRALDLVAPTSGAYVGGAPAAGRAAHRRRSRASTSSRAAAASIEDIAIDPRDRLDPRRRRSSPPRSPRWSATVTSRRRTIGDVAGHRAGPARRGRAGVPRAGDAHLRPRRADPARRRGQRGAPADAGVTDPTPIASTARGRVPAVRRGRRRHRPVLRGVRHAARRDRRRGGARPSRHRSAATRRRAAGAARRLDGARAAARSTPTAGARRAGCGRRANATTSASSRRPTSRWCATRGSCTPATRTRPRSRSSDRAPGARRVRRGHDRDRQRRRVARRGARGARRARGCADRRRRPRPAAVVEHWTQRPRRRDRSRAGRRGHCPTSRSPRAANPPSTHLRRRGRRRSGPRRPRWVGDSRCYWLPDDGPAVQVSTDDSWASAQIAQGTHRDVAEADPRAHAITRWLGVDSPGGAPSTASVALDGAGWVLVCSDGLWNYCSSADDLRVARR